MRTAMILVCSALLACAACDDSQKSAPPSPAASSTPAAPAPTPVPTPKPAVTATPSASAAVAAPAQKVEIAIGSVGDTMAYDKTALTVPTGAQVHLVLKNNGVSAVMQHNWVLVNPGKEAAVAAEGLAKAATSGYVVPGPDVLVYTPLAPPGKTTEVTFTAPAPGKYPYICTYPGHYVVMKGVLTVTP